MSMLEGKGRHGGWLNNLEGPSILEGHIMKKVLFLCIRAKNYGGT